MTPDPRSGPFVGHHDGAAWLVVPCRDAAGVATDLRLPLDLTAAIRLAAQACDATAALHHASRRAAYLAQRESDTNDDGLRMARAVST